MNNVSYLSKGRHTVIATVGFAIETKEREHNFPIFQAMHSTKAQSLCNSISDWSKQTRIGTCVLQRTKLSKPTSVYKC